ncbi:MAG: alkaline phosphatase family protein [Vicinamibacterales bacterium]
MIQKLLFVCAASLVLLSPAGGAKVAPFDGPRAAPPKLIVQLVLDQLRADYPARYGAQWTAGLRRLMTEGAHFTNARYPFAGTATCPGHASIGTGTVPAVHGMALNEWWDRQTRRRTPCTSDPDVTGMGFTKPVTSGYSARWQMAQTFAERLRASQPAGAGRVVSLSLKARSAIALAGHTGDAVVWMDPSGTFATSSAYGHPAWLAEYLKANPIERAVAESWTRARPAPAYQGTDAGIGERPPSGWTPRFPHALSNGAVADGTFYDRWQRSPLSDAYLGQMAIAAIDALGLGRSDGTDYLAVSFSALDLVGHKFGPRSHEVQDVLIRADETIGRLLDHLDATVGRANYVLALTSDHGVGEVPETPGVPGGRLPRGAVTTIIEDTLDKTWGDGTYVDHELYTEVYLTAASLTRLMKEPATLAKLKTGIEALPSVLRVMSGADMARERGSDDPMMRAVLLSYYPGRSGDLMLLLREHHTASTDAASHGTYYDYDRRVPVMLFGSPFKAGTYAVPVSPLDIPATWSRLTGVALDRPHGRSLDAAVK